MEHHSSELIGFINFHLQLTFHSKMIKIFLLITFLRIQLGLFPTIPCTNDWKSSVLQEVYVGPSMESISIVEASHSVNGVCHIWLICEICCTFQGRRSRAARASPLFAPD